MSNQSGRFLFTSESVSMGHPDKLADRISDSILDALLAQDPNSRVACETLVNTNLAVIAGEITTKAEVDYEQIVRDAIVAVGYTNADTGIADGASVTVPSAECAEVGHRPAAEDEGSIGATGDFSEARNVAGGIDSACFRIVAAECAEIDD